MYAVVKHSISKIQSSKLLFTFKCLNYWTVAFCWHLEFPSECVQICSRFGSSVLISHQTEKVLVMTKKLNLPLTQSNGVTMPKGFSSWQHSWTVSLLWNTGNSHLILQQKLGIKSAAVQLLQALGGSFCEPM